MGRSYLSMQLHESLGPAFKLAISTWNNSLITGIYPDGSARKYVPMSPPPPPPHPHPHPHPPHPPPPQVYNFQHIFIFEIVFRILRHTMRTINVYVRISPFACLTHWGRDKMHAIFQTTFSNGFYWMKIYEFQLKFHWSLLLRVQLTIPQHWFR